MKKVLGLAISVAAIVFSSLALIAVGFTYFLKSPSLNFSTSVPGKVEYVFSSNNFSPLNTTNSLIKEKQIDFSTDSLPEISCDELNQKVTNSESDSFNIKGLHCSLLSTDIKTKKEDTRISNLQFFEEIDNDNRFVFFSKDEINYFYKFLFNNLFHAQEILDLKGIYLSVYDADSGATSEGEAGHYNPSTKTIVIKIDSSSYNKSVKELSSEEKIMSIWGVIVHEYGHHFFENYFKRLPWKRDSTKGEEIINTDNISLYNACSSSTYNDASYNVSKYEKFCSDSYINKRTTYEVINDTGNNINKNVYSYNFKDEKLPENTTDFQNSFSYRAQSEGSKDNWIYNYSKERYESSKNSNVFNPLNKNSFSNAEYYHSYDEIFARNFMMSSVPSLFNFAHQKNYGSAYNSFESQSFGLNSSRINSCSNIFICVPYTNNTLEQVEFKSLKNVDPFFLEYWKSTSMNNAFNSFFGSSKMFKYDRADQLQENKILNNFLVVSGANLPVSYTTIDLIGEIESKETTLFSSYSGWTQKKEDSINVEYKNKNTIIKPMYNSENINYVSNLYTLKDTKNLDFKSYESKNGLSSFINNNIIRQDDLNNRAYYFSLTNIKKEAIESNSLSLSSFVSYDFKIKSFINSETKQNYELFNLNSKISPHAIWNNTFGQYDRNNSNYVETAKNILPNGNGVYRQFLRSLGDGRYESKIYWLNSVLKYDSVNKQFIYDVL